MNILIYFTIALKIHSMFREYTINSVFISQVHFEFTVESQIHCEFPNNFANLLNLYLSFSRKYHKFTIFLAIWLWIHCLLRWFIINTLSISRIYLEFTIFFASSLWIYFLYYDFTINLVDFSRIYFLIHYLLREFTIYFAKQPWIYYLFQDYTMNSLSVSRIYLLYYEFTINLTDWIHF